MRKVSIKNRKYLDRLAERDPKLLKDLKHRKKLSSCKSFIRLHSTQADLVDLKEVIKMREEELKKEASVKPLEK